MRCKYISKLILFEDKYLHVIFKRFTNVINNDFNIISIYVSLKLDKKHFYHIVFC